MLSPIGTNISHDETIFVSIAAYRDKNCNRTIKNLFDTAQYPQNIFIGICQQNKADEDDDCLHDIPPNLLKNIRIIRLAHTEARGPTYARYICSTLYHDENYFLQIDSHTLFVKNWDMKLINMIKYLKTIVENPVLSVYPREIKDLDKNDDKITRMCRAYFNKRGMISFAGSEIVSSDGTFKQSPFIAAGFIFCEGKMLHEVPYDPHLPYVFIGEEILLSIRLYTSGYDIFSPHENIVYHLYTRADEKKIWNDLPTYDDTFGINKIKKIIGLSDADVINNQNIEINPKYGLGNKRTLAQFYNYAEIDIINKKVYSNFCRPDNKGSNEDIVKSNELLIEKFEYNIDGCCNCNFTISDYIICIILLGLMFSLL